MTYRGIVTAVQAGGGWKRHMGELIEAARELREHGGEMDAYTRNRIKEEIRLRKEAHYKTIVTGVVEEINAAIGDLQQAQEAREYIRGVEVRSWDAAKLGNALQLAQAQVQILVNSNSGGGFGGVTPSMRFRKLWQETQAGGDRYAIRAFSEVLEGAQAKDHDTQLTINELVRESAGAVLKLRYTNALQKADKAVEESEKYLLETVNVDRQAWIDLGESDPANVLDYGPVAQAIKRVQVDPAGRVAILAADDPEVTGVGWDKFDMPTAGG